MNISTAERPASTAGAAKAGQPARRASPPGTLLGEFWPVASKKTIVHQADWRRELRDLVDRVSASPGVALFNVVEAGVPTRVVTMIAGATGEPAASGMELIGVPQTTFRRKEEAREPLPDVAGHRVMGYLRVVATLRRLLDESGDPEQVKDFDLEGWVARWMRLALPELGGKTPAEMLRNPEGQRAIEQVIERMRGGLAA